MDSLKSVLFENPLYLYITLGIVELVLVYLWWDRRAEKVGRKYLLAMIAPPLIGLGVLLLSTFIITDREQIIAAAHEIAADMAGEGDAAIQKYLDHNFVVTFGGQPYDRETVLLLVRTQRRMHAIRQIDITSATVDVKGEFAKMNVTTSMTAEAKELNSEFRQPVQFDVTWVKRAEGWRVLECDEPKAGQ